MNKKGDWVQIYAIMFFFLLLILGLALFFVEKDGLRTERPENIADFSQARSDIFLISLLRTPTMLDINGDGTPDPATFADKIVHGITEEELEKEIKRIIPDSAFEITITYPGETVHVNRIPDPFDTLVKNKGPASTSTMLPGKTGTILVYLTYATRADLEYILGGKDE